MGRGRGGGRGEEECLEEHEDDGAVPVERACPGQSDGVSNRARPSTPTTAAPAGEGRPAASRATRLPDRPRGHHPQGGSESASRTPATSRGDGHPAAAGQAAHKSACAAARPLAMQAGMPTPWYAAPARATPPRRATAASTPAIRSRWCTRYWGRACGVAHHDRIPRLSGDAHERAELLPGPGGHLLVAPPARAVVVDAAERGPQQHLSLAGKVGPLAVQERAGGHRPGVAALVGASTGHQETRSVQG